MYNKLSAITNPLFNWDYLPCLQISGNAENNPY